MNRILVAATLAFSLFALPTLPAQPQTEPLAAGQAGSNSLDPELTQAAARGDWAAVQRLRQKGANLEATDKWGYTPLLQAVQNGKIEVVRLLLEKGANIEAADGGGTALLLAAGEAIPRL
jgi:ankyrin repeat protein